MAEVVYTGRPICRSPNGSNRRMTHFIVLSQKSRLYTMTKQSGEAWVCHKVKQQHERAEQSHLQWQADLGRHWRQRSLLWQGWARALPAPDSLHRRRTPGQAPARSAWRALERPWHRRTTPQMGCCCPTWAAAAQAEQQAARLPAGQAVGCPGDALGRRPQRQAVPQKCEQQGLESHSVPGTAASTLQRHTLQGRP